MARYRLLVLAVALAGCANSPQGSALLDYAIEQDGVPVGHALWSLGHGQAQFIDVGGREVSGSVVVFSIVADTVVNATLIVDMTTGQEIAAVNDCDPGFACEQTLVEWGDPDAPGAWFGAAGLRDLDPASGRIDAGREAVDVSVTGESPRYAITPHAHPRRIPGLCNLLDDKTEVDVERHVIVRCEHGGIPGLVYRLSNDGALPAFSRPGSIPAGIAEAAPFTGAFPAASEDGGEDLGLGEAHAAALNLSQGLRDFIWDHPEAMVETAQSTTGAAQDQVVVATRVSALSIQYVASGQAGYEVEVERTLRHVADQALPPAYALRRDAPWTPPEDRRWEEMERPAKLVPMSAAAAAVEALVAGWSVEGVSMIDDARAGARGPLVRYYVALGTEACEAAESCVSSDVVIVDAASGRLVAAQLSGARLSALLRTTPG